LRVCADRLAPAAAFVALICIWEAGCRFFAIPSYLLPGPSAIAAAGLKIQTATGLMATPEELIELSRSLRAGRTREMLHIRLPYAVPFIFSPLEISTTLAVIGVVVA
jgi:ABC-type nitrate/sulfonate/bicarbonate transport system permease component